MTHSTTATTTAVLQTTQRGELSWYQKKNILPLTPILITNHPLSPSSIYYNHPCSIYLPDSLFAPSLSKFSLVYLLTWHLALHTPYISSHNHYILLATHAHCNLFCCSTEIMSSNPSLSLNSWLRTQSFTLMPHIHLTILISALWSATSFSFLTGQVSLPCNILLRTQLLYNLPLTFNDISLLVSNGTNCLNLFHTIRILVSTAASASPSTLNMSPK